MTDYIKSARFGASLGVLTYFLGWIVGFFMKNGGQPQASLSFAPLTDTAKNVITSNIDTSLASKILAWISGINPFDIVGLITIAIAGVIIAVVGAFLLDLLKNTAIGKWIAGGNIRQIVGITAIGSLTVGLAVSLFAGSPQIPAFTATITMLIYFTIVAYVFKGLQTLFPALEKNGLLTSPSK